MPAASKAIKYTWIPKGAGRGGMFSNSTSHDSDTDTLVRVYDFLIDGGKWCPRPAETVFSNTIVGHAQAMFIYNFYNETSTVGTSKLLTDLISYGSAQQNHTVYRVEDLPDLEPDIPASTSASQLAKAITEQTREKRGEMKDE